MAIRASRIWSAAYVVSPHPAAAAPHKAWHASRLPTWRLVIQNDCAPSEEQLLSESSANWTMSLGSDLWSLKFRFARQPRAWR